MMGFFQQIAEIQKPTAKFEGSFFLLTGRATLFDQVDVLLPRGSHLFSLEPFTKEQMRIWSDKWNKQMNLSDEKIFDGTVYWKEDDEEPNDLSEIARQPLLLNLLALLHSSGSYIDPSLGDRSKASVYKTIIEWVCDRHEELRSKPNNKITMDSDSMRLFLRIAGFCTHAYNRRDIHIKNLQDLIEESGLIIEEIESEDNYESQQTFLSFSFHKVGKSSWEFLHKSFGEYLAAEYIFEELREMCNLKNELDITRHWIRITGPSFISPEIEEYITQMLRNNLSREEFIKIVKIIEKMFIRFDKEKDWEDIHNISRSYEIPPTQAFANIGATALLFGAICSRLHKDLIAEDYYFSPENLVKGSWLRTYGAIERWFNMHRFSERVFEGISLDSKEGIDLDDYHATSHLFDRLQVSKFFNSNPQFNDARFYKSRLVGADFKGSDLRGADFSNVDLSGACFSGATLADSNFENANLSGSDFKESDMRNSRFSSSELQNSVFVYADFSGSNLSSSCLKDCDLSSAVLEESNLSEADLSGADLSGVNIKEAYFDGNIF